MFGALKKIKIKIDHMNIMFILIKLNAFMLGYIIQPYSCQI